MSTVANSNPHLNYIDHHLIAEILEKLVGETFERYEVEHAGGLDGFMSALYNIKLFTETAAGPKERLLIAKFMKGDSNFRETSKSYVQFANEIYIYAKVLPTYQQVLEEAGVTDIKVTDWVAPCYVAKFGSIQGLSSTREERDSVLVLENLKPAGYVLGPHQILTREHMLLMSSTLGQYHALTYALRLKEDPRLEQLKAGIVTLPFCYKGDAKAEQHNLYHFIYRAAFDRFFKIIDRVSVDGKTLDRNLPEDARFLSNVERIREKYFANPSHLLEHLRIGIELSAEDQRFAAILHGDYNRNNVLFRYKAEKLGSASGDAVAAVEDVKMIDFQELRYGSPALDLSFYMYINSSTKERDSYWMELLQCYHAHMLETLSKTVKGNISDPQQLQELDQKLQSYSFEKFNAHFSKFAFYGIIICMHFLPWLVGSTEECARLSHLFETNMQGEEFHQLSIDAGGDVADQEILARARHASRMGYMDAL